MGLAHGDISHTRGFVPNQGEMTAIGAWNQIFDLEAAVLRTKGHQEGGGSHWEDRLFWGGPGSKPWEILREWLMGGV